MDSEEINQRLSKIETIWETLRQAETGSPEAAAQARGLLLLRYQGAVYRYLLGAVRDPQTAEDLAQIFALGLARGDFRHADPQRGRFRDYIKTALFHLVGKHRKAQQKQPRAVPPDSAEMRTLTAAEDPDGAFDAGWRDHLLEQTWRALEVDRPAQYAVLRLRADHPKMASEEMARQLGQQLGKPLTAENVRQTLQRARTRFVHLLIDEVARTLESPTPEDVEEELRSLGLLAYCQPIWDRRSRARKGP